MAQRTAIGLTGDDLTVADVWAVAVEQAPAGLSDAARQKMRAARELVERMGQRATVMWRAAGSAYLERDRTMAERLRRWDDELDDAA